MTGIVQAIGELNSSRRGATALEYGLLAMLFGGGMVVCMDHVGASFLVACNFLSHALGVAGT